MKAKRQANEFNYYDLLLMATTHTHTHTGEASSLAAPLHIYVVLSDAPVLPKLVQALQGVGKVSVTTDENDCRWDLGTDA